MKMAASPRVWSVVKKHVPLIKFRKGAGVNHGYVVDSPVSCGSSGSAAQTAPVTLSKPLTIAPRASIEDWQLSSRYKRRPLSVEEIEYINRGGPA